MSLLHTVSKSPFERSALESCLDLAKQGSGILLYEDAVVAAMKGGKFAARIEAAAKSCAVHVLGPDLKARGFDPANVVPGVKVVDYSGFVDLAAAHKAVQAWC
jgi:tRNA 2-thiouridine synthesizing protein B